METSWFIKSHLKKFLIICTATASIFLIKRFMDKKRDQKKSKKSDHKKKIKEFPTVDEIQKFIEDLPFDAVASLGKSVTLKDLLGELSEFSDDEDWKELIASVHSLYEVNDSGKIEENLEETGSIMSIYEDSNVINLNGITQEDDDDQLSDLKSIKNEDFKDNIGNGDVAITDLKQSKQSDNDDDDDDIEKLIDMGQGDENEKNFQL